MTVPDITLSNELTISQADFNSLIQILTSILGRPPSLYETGKVLETIGTLNELETDETDDFE